MTAKRTSWCGGRGLGRGGVTLLELIVAIAVSAIAVGMIFQTWTSLSRHMHANERRSNLRVSADRISETLAMELRRSHAVVAWGSNGITFETVAGDTVRYEHNGMTLVRNGSPVHVSSPGGYVGTFDVTRAEDAGQLVDREQERVLLRVDLTVEDSLENTAGAQVEVSVRLVSGAETWGF